MANKPRRTADEDEAQSQRFIQTATDLEAAGDLNLTEAAESFDKLSDSLLRPPADNVVRDAEREAREKKK